MAAAARKTHQRTGGEPVGYTRRYPGIPGVGTGKPATGTAGDSHSDDPTEGERTPSPLANHEKAVRTSEPDASTRRRDEAYRLREVLWDVSKIRRVTWCGRLAAKGKNANPATPEIRMAEGRAYYSGVARCGSVWACPVCSRRIRHERSLEAEAGFREWLERGHALIFLTLTLPHGMGDSCADLMEAIKGGWKAVFSGRPYRRDRERFGIRHWFRGWDATYGQNGWHPHLHMALLLDDDLDRGDLNALEEHLYSRWASAIERYGHRQPSREHGIHLEPAKCSKILSRYLMKVRGTSTESSVAIEITRGDLKRSHGGRTPFQILAGFADTGEVNDLARWWEWEGATKGQHFTRWSNGTRAELGMVEGRSDEEIMEERVGGTVVYSFTPREWHFVRVRRGLQARLLRAAEDSGAAGVTTTLEEAACRRLRGQTASNAIAATTDEPP